MVYTAVNPGTDYFALAQWSDEFTFDGHPTELTYWNRPPHAMTDAIADAGLSVMSEPPHLSRDPARAPASQAGTMAH